MSNAPRFRLAWGLRPWQTILLFGLLLCFIYGIGSLTLDYFAGGATESFGVWPKAGGVGMFFVYVLSFYIALVVVLPIVMLQRFGVGLAVWLPYAVLGLFVEGYMELVATRSLLGPWAAVGWCLIGLLVGLSADVAYRFLPVRLDPRARAVSTGVAMGVTNFLLILVALFYFYTEQPTGAGTFLGVAYYGLPLLIINSGFGGYVAFAISERA